MSPLFHRTERDSEGDGSAHRHLPSLFELGAQLDEVVAQTAALPLDQLAQQLMSRYFSADHRVASQITSMVSVDTICWDLLPENAGEHAGEPIPDGFFSLQDLVTEAVQLLRTAGLVMERSYKVGQDRSYSQWLSGLVATRRGRSALANNALPQILGHVYAPLA